jgi:dTDP-4-dehydrorhamnose reductase
MTTPAFKGRVVVLGGRGMLGKAVCVEARAAGYQVWATDSRVMNITDPKAMHDISTEIQPDVVVNCAGVIPAKLHRNTIMVATNALGPWIVREAFPNSQIVHVSTDCVFAGVRRTRKWSTVDTPDAVTVYGRSKAMGECAAAVNVRTSFIGLDHGLLPWLLSQPAGSTVPGWTRAIWNGGTVYSVAQALVQQFFNADRGWYHLGGDATFTKYQLLQMLAGLFDLDVKITPVAEGFNRELSCTNYMDVDFEELVRRHAAIKEAIHAG